ncbi:MAG: hypothetical protein K9G25_06235 [Sphingomonadaceae bacterium]|nr:hypothetical protein [Sphingomonadaceae bacterium]
MAASSQKMTANRQNASLSTGPSTTAGKAKSSRNALKHGILSNSMLVEGEDEREYDALLQAIIDDEQPQTTLEMLQCEQVVQCYWRIRRLVGAEAAAIAFHRQADDTRKMLNETIGIAGSFKFKDEHLEPLEESELINLSACQNVLEEMNKLQYFPEDEGELKKVLPVYSSYLHKQAKQQGKYLYDYLMKRTGLAEDQFAESIKRCVAADKKTFDGMVQSYEQRRKVMEMRADYQDIKMIPPETERFARYRAANENSLEKAVRALRQSQALRLVVIQGEAKLVEEEK